MFSMVLVGSSHFLIRIRIQGNDTDSTDPDPDPPHCYCYILCYSSNHVRPALTVWAMTIPFRWYLRGRRSWRIRLMSMGVARRLWGSWRPWTVRGGCWPGSTRARPSPPLPTHSLTYSSMSGGGSYQTAFFVCFLQNICVYWAMGMVGYPQIFFPPFGLLFVL